MQDCVTNPCINLLAPPSVTRKYHPKVLELLHLLQCIAAHLQRTLPWVYRVKVTGGRQHRTPATLPIAFNEEPDRMLSQGRQSMCRVRRLWHTPTISRKFGL